MRRALLLAIPALLLAASNMAGGSTAEAAAAAAAANAPLTQPSAPPNAPFRIQEVADLAAPWAMTFLPDGRMLITEKAGQLLLLSADGRQRKTITGTPPVMSEGQ